MTDISFRLGLPGGGGVDTIGGGPDTPGTGGGGSCEDCGGGDFWGGSYCTFRQRHFINAGDGAYVPSEAWSSDYTGQCTWLECVQDPSSSTGLSCTEYEGQKTLFQCRDVNGQWQPFNNATVTLEELKIFGFLKNCFDARWNEERYNRDGQTTIRDQIVPSAIETDDTYGGGGDIVSYEELREANKGCGLGVSSNAHGRIVQCDDAQTMGTLINHWEYGDKSGSIPNAPKTPIKTCLLPRKWTTQDTLDFIGDHWTNPLTTNPSDRGPSIFPSRRPGAPGFTFRSTDSNKKINYAKRDDEYSISYKMIKTVQNGKQVDICAPVFGLSSEYENLPNCENM